MGGDWLETPQQTTARRFRENPPAAVITRESGTGRAKEGGERRRGKETVAKGGRRANGNTMG